MSRRRLITYILIAVVILLAAVVMALYFYMHRPLRADALQRISQSCMPVVIERSREVADSTLLQYMPERAEVYRLEYGNGERAMLLPVETRAKQADLQKRIGEDGTFDGKDTLFADLNEGILVLSSSKALTDSLKEDAANSILLNDAFSTVLHSAPSTPDGEGICTSFRNVERDVWVALDINRQPDTTVFSGIYAANYFTDLQRQLQNVHNNVASSLHYIPNTLHGAEVDSVEVQMGDFLGEETAHVTYAGGKRLMVVKPQNATVAQGELNDLLATRYGAEPAYVATLTPTLQLSLPVYTAFSDSLEGAQYYTLFDGALYLGSSVAEIDEAVRQVQAKVVFARNHSVRQMRRLLPHKHVKLVYSRGAKMFVSVSSLSGIPYISGVKVGMIESDVPVQVAKGEEFYEEGKYPFMAPAKVVAPISQITYDNSPGVRYFVPCADKTIYLYNAEGKVVPDWTRPRLVTPATMPVRHFLMNNKDYLVFADSLNLYITDRKGRPRVTPDKAFTPKPQSSVTIIKDSAFVVPCVDGRKAIVDVATGKVAFTIDN